ncbi:serine hydrolase [Candidatus Pelagibacter sp.]|nr:serine hydrolase [Candidatus Pelagibacter sp.]
MNNYKSFLFILILSVFYHSLALAEHLKGKSKAEKDAYLKMRIVDIPAAFKKVQISPANKVKTLNDELIENKNTKEIDKNIKNKSLLSVLYFDGQKIVVNKKSEKIQDDTKLYSFSISKSFVSYILGNAICNGDIKSLDDKISDYVPETKGTLYENSSFKDLINMKAGDTNFASRKAGSATFIYAGQIAQKKQTVKEYLTTSSNLKTTKKVFNYNNFLTDLVARAIDLKFSGGLKEAYQDFANKAGTSSEMFFLTDNNGWPILHAWFYASREDFLKLGIQISNDWNSNTCIGNYLKNIESMRGKSDIKNSEYSGYFWYDSKNKTRHAEMRGHGGQRIYIDLEKNRVLTYHSISGDYDNKSIWNLLK